jgi:hypothetical protein
MMRVEFPGVTDEEIQWLSTMAEEVGQPVSPTPRGSSNSTGARTTPAGLGEHRDKRGRVHSWSAGKKNRARSRSPSPLRRSTRHRTEPEQTMNNEQQASGPSGIDRQTSTHRRQLSRAFRELYGTPEVPYGIIFGLTVLARYVYTLEAILMIEPPKRHSTPLRAAGSYQVKFWATAALRALGLGPRIGQSSDFGHVRDM